MIRIWIKNSEGQWQALEGLWGVDEVRYWLARIQELGGKTMFTRPDEKPGGGK